MRHRSGFERPHHLRGAEQFLRFAMSRRGSEHGFEEGGEGGAGPFGFGRGRGGGRKRVVDGNELRLVLLALIAERPRHGYELIREIEERTGGAYAPSPGMVYPTLTLLAETGLVIEQSSDGARKLFAISEEGTQHLSDNEKEWKQLLERFDTMGQARDMVGIGQAREAVHNLFSTMKKRFFSGMTDEQLHAAIALLDETARKIERL